MEEQGHSAFTSAYTELRASWLSIVSEELRFSALWDVNLGSTHEDSLSKSLKRKLAQLGLVSKLCHRPEVLEP